MEHTGIRTLLQHDDRSRRPRTFYWSKMVPDTLGTPCRTLVQTEHNGDLRITGRLTWTESQPSIMCKRLIYLLVTGPSILIDFNE